MFNFDNEFRKQGFKRLVGCDEVGRGCIAGPVVAACVILPFNYQNSLIKDSKKLTKKEIAFLYNEITKNAIEYQIGFVNEEKIDEINILQASKLAIENSLNQFNSNFDLILIDHLKVNSNHLQKNITQGDNKSLTIATASIIAKYTRDLYMQKIDEDFPNYDWKNNVGYPTIKHKEAILNFGITKHHRKSFKPIKEWIENQK